MSYVEEALQLVLENEIGCNAIREQELSLICDVLVTCESNFIDISDEIFVLEAIGKKKEGIFTKIKKFIDDIIEKFITKAKELVSTSDAWVKANEKVFTDGDYTSQSIKLPEYWNIANSDISAIIQNSINTIAANYSDEDVTKYSDEKNILESLAPFNKHLDKNKDYTESTKNYFLTKTVDVSPSKIFEGDAARNIIISNIIPFVKWYNNIITDLKNKKNTFKSKMDDIDRRINKETASSTTESRTVLESFIYNNTILTEAEDNTTNKPDDKDDGAKVDTSVSVKNEENVKTGNADAPASSIKSSELKFRRNLTNLTLITITSAMSAYEKKFTVYMKILKGIYNNIKGTVKSVPTNTKENDKKKKK